MKKAVRLDKFLADAGAGTRSEVKKFIQKEGKIIKILINRVETKGISLIFQIIQY